MNIFEKSFTSTEKLATTLFALFLIFYTSQNVSSTVPTNTSTEVLAGSSQVATSELSTAATKYAFADDVQAFASNASRDVKTSTVELPVSDYDTSYSGMDLPRNDSFDFKNGGAVLRAFYVIMGFTLVVVVYFVLRAVRLRRKRNKSHKYGIISTNADMELTPFDVQEDEDETTVFEVATNHA